MLPDIWGKYMWVSLHLIALGYPTNPSIEEKQAYKDYFENIYKILPCHKCSVHYKQHVNSTPITDDILNDNRSLFKWTVVIHNSVNASIGKPIIKFEDAIELYITHYVSKNDLIKNTFYNVRTEVPTHPPLTSKTLHKPVCLYVVAFILLIMFLIIFFITLKPNISLKKITKKK